MSIRLKMQTTSKEILELLEKMEQNMEIKQDLKEMMCEQIKNKIENNSSMNLVSEEILEDGSVVITVNV